MAAEASAKTVVLILLLCKELQTNGEAENIAELYAAVLENRADIERAIPLL